MVDNGFIAPIAPPETNKVSCAECGKVFSKKANLNRHMETKHADQSSTAVVAKALKLKKYRKVNRCARRNNDNVYPEKLLKTNRTAYHKKKAR